jgi:hypothetical protein
VRKAPVGRIDDGVHRFVQQVALHDQEFGALRSALAVQDLGRHRRG